MERNWCRGCGLDYTHGDLVKPPVVEAASDTCAPPPAFVQSSSYATAGARTPVAQRIRLRKALLAAARQHGDGQDVQEEVRRHEAELARLTAEERASQPTEDRLRSLLDRVRHKEQVADAADAKVKELSTQLAAATAAATEARSALDADRREMAELKAAMASPPQVGPAPRPEAATPPAALAEAKATEASLNAVLAAFAMAAKEGSTIEERQGLEGAVQQAKDQATAREAAREAAKQAAEAKATAETSAMAVDRAEGSKRKGEEPSMTQPGDQDLQDEELEALLSKVPPGKRQPALDRLTQLGVADHA